ncbi:insulinase family protein [bacterium]|nr:insulinase family protein [bacterium]
MKNLFLGLTLALLGFHTVEAQIDRSVQPAPQKERPLKIGKAEEFELANGLKVIVVTNTKLSRVNYRLVMDRKPYDLGDKAGLDDLLSGMLSEGTTTRTKAQLDEEIDFLGANINISANGASASGLSKSKEPILALMADMMLHPAFSPESFDKLLKQARSGLDAEKEDPNAMADKLSRSVVFGAKHPYGQIATEASLANIQLEDLKALYARNTSPKNSYIAVVGDISKKETKKLIEKYLGAWSGPEIEQSYPVYTGGRAGNTVHIVNRESSVQSNINIAHAIALPEETDDHMAVRVMNQILGGGSAGRLFQNLREDKAYTYGAYSDVRADRYGAEFSATAEVRNEVTDSAVEQILLELKRIAETPVSDEEFKAAKEALKGSFGRSLESPGTVANFALNVKRFNLAPDYYDNYLLKLESVTPADVQRVAQEYITGSGLQINVVGKARDIAKKLQRFGPISYYDFEGKPTAPPVEFPEGLTAEKVIEDYLNALGGREKLGKIKELKLEREATIQGFSLKMTEAYVFPDKAYKIQDLGPMGKIEMVRKAENYKMLQNGQAMPIGDEDLASLRDELQWLPELTYANGTPALKLTGIQEVGGRKAYLVEVRGGSESVIEFFDAENGLKLRSQMSVEGSNGEPVSQNIDYLDYKAYEGIMIPERILLPLGPMSAELKLTKASVNKGVDRKVFDK